MYGRILQKSFQMQRAIFVIDIILFGQTFPVLIVT